MCHLESYKFQTEARGVRTLEDVRRATGNKAYIFNRIVRNWLPADTSLPIAELACGHGTFLHWLQTQKFSNLAGVDASAEQVGFARQLGIPVDQEDVNTWLARQPENHFAALVAIDLIEHLPKDDFLKFLQAARRALAPGGSLILRLPNGDSPFVGRNLFNDITHVWAYTSNCLQTLAAMQGYQSAAFADEGADVIRDHRWLKVPLARIAAKLMHLLIQCAAREKIEYWNAFLWARLVK